MAHTIHIIAGPTASGKSARALAMAAELNGVVINADSMQIYAGLPILTAQPVAEEQKQIPHVLYAVLHPNELCSAARWRDLAMAEIENICTAGQTPLITGGTGFYIQALTEGLSPMPDIPQDIRTKANALFEEMGGPAFHVMLAARDPESAARLHPHHSARLIRAWEVWEATGRSLSGWQNEPRILPPEDWHFEVHKIVPEREELYARINTRFEGMMENGALEEALALHRRIENGEVKPDSALTRAHGYKALIRYHNGEISRDEALNYAQTETRQYAKRQMTWLRTKI